MIRMKVCKLSLLYSSKLANNRGISNNWPWQDTSSQRRYIRLGIPDPRNEKIYSRIPGNECPRLYVYESLQSWQFKGSNGFIARKNGSTESSTTQLWIIQTIWQQQSTNCNSKLDHHWFRTLSIYSRTIVWVLTHLWPTAARAGKSRAENPHFHPFPGL